jgi:hypothetical protein
VTDSPARIAYKAAHKRASRAEARDIGQTPPVQRPEIKEDCRLDLLRFLRTYMAPRFPLAFSDDHLALISSIQGIILHGGLRALAMPRGSFTAIAGFCS